MFKAVFFDLYHTLVTYDPPQEELEAGALKEMGVDVQPVALRSPIIVADEFIYNEIARRPLSHRSQEEKLALYMQHQEMILREAAVPYDTRIVMGLLGKMQQAQMKLVLFDDVAPALTELKKRGLILGLISNLEQDANETLNRLGLHLWLEIVVTSKDAGVNKPQPEIFLEAINRAGVQPAEALYIGDQYQVDILGANGAGMKGILLDRNDHYQRIKDSPRIQHLTEISGLLQ